MAFIEMDFATGGGEDGVKVVKLWENPTPTANFGAQTISLDLSMYEGVLIKARYTTASATTAMTYIKKGTVDNTDSKFSRVYSHYYRTATVTDTGVAFGTPSQSNGVIPVTIYGITKDLEDIAE